MSSDLRPWSNAFVGAIAGPLPRGETGQQKGFDLAYWPRQFLNDSHIAGRNNSNLDVSSYNTNLETKLLGATHKMRNSLGAGYIIGL